MMTHRLSLVTAFVAAITVFACVTEANFEKLAIGDFTPGNLEIFRWVEAVSTDGQGRAASDDRNLQICYTSLTPEQDDLNDGSIVYGEIHQLTYHGNADTVYSVQATSPHTNTDDLICDDYNVDSSTIDFENPQLYQVIADNNIYWATFSMTLHPGSLQVEDLTNGLRRVSSKDNSYEISDCLAKFDSACYISNCSYPCITVKTDQLVGSVQVCDAPTPIPSVSAPASYDDVTISYDDGTLTITQEAGESGYLEIMRETSTPQKKATKGSKAGGCVGPDPDVTFEVCRDSTCTVGDFVPSESQYTFSVVNVDDDGNAVGFSEVSVTDVAVSSVAVSVDTVRVNWEYPEDSQSFTVSISPAPTDAAYSNLTGPCETNNDDFCEVFFIKVANISADNKLTLYDKQQKLTIETEVTKGNNPQQDETTKLSTSSYSSTLAGSGVNAEVCFTTEAKATDLLQLIFVDPVSGDNVRSLEIENDCFESILLPESIITTDEKIRIMMLNVGSTSYDQIDVYFFGPTFEQVGKDLALATWNNENNGQYSDPLQDDGAQFACSFSPCHYYAVRVAVNNQSTFSLQEDITSPSNFSQIANVEVIMTDITEMTVTTPFASRTDGRLEVCFTASLGYDTKRYALGVSLADGTPITSDDNAQQETGPDGETCVRTSSPVYIGDYVDLWAAVTAYSAADVIVEAGLGNYEDLFLSSDASVLVLSQQQDGTSGDESKFNILTSWYLLDNAEDNFNQNVTLYDSSGISVKTETFTETNTKSNTFEDLEAGSYYVCVKVILQSDTDITAEQCSSVVYAKEAIGTNLPPSVSAVQFIYDSDGSVTVSWDMSSDEDLESVAAFLITWSEVSEVKAALSSAENYQLVPGSQSTVALNIEDGTWNVCLHAISGNELSEVPACEDTVVDFSAENFVGVPRNLDYDASSNLLSWDSTDCNGDLCSQYHVEWKQGSTIRYEDVDDTFLELSSVGPGEWLMSVTAVNDDMYAGDPAHKWLELIGLTGHYSQSGSSQVTVSWEETSASDVNQDYTYTVNSGSTEVATVTCGASQDCLATVYDIVEDTVISVTRQDDASLSWTYKVTLEDIDEVVELSRYMDSHTEATVSWQCVDGASEYNVTLYDADEVLKETFFQSPCLYVFTESSDLEGYIVTVQACTAVTGTTCLARCGDFSDLRIAYPTNPEEPTNVLAIVLSSVFIGLVLILIVMAIVYNSRKRKSKKAESTAGDEEAIAQDAAGIPDNDANDDGTVNPAHVDVTVAAAVARPPSAKSFTDNGRFEQYPPTTSDPLQQQQQPPLQAPVVQQEPMQPQPIQPQPTQPQPMQPQPMQPQPMQPQPQPMQPQPFMQPQPIHQPLQDPMQQPQRARPVSLHQQQQKMLAKEMTQRQASAPDYYTNNISSPDSRGLSASPPKEYRRRSSGYADKYGHQPQQKGMEMDEMYPPPRRAVSARKEYGQERPPPQRVMSDKDVNGPPPRRPPRNQPRTASLSPRRRGADDYNSSPGERPGRYPSRRPPQQRDAPARRSTRRDYPPPGGRKTQDLYEMPPPGLERSRSSAAAPRNRSNIPRIQSSGGNQRTRGESRRGPPPPPRPNRSRSGNAYNRRPEENW